MSESRDKSSTHWLQRASTIRRLWWVMYGVLALTVLAQFVVPLKGKFTIDGWLAFPAIYGFVTCVAMVLFAKLLGVWLKRKDGYYDD